MANAEGTLSHWHTKAIELRLRGDGGIFPCTEHDQQKSHSKSGRDERASIYRALPVLFNFWEQVPV